MDFIPATVQQAVITRLAKNTKSLPGIVLIISLLCTLPLPGVSQEKTDSVATPAEGQALFKSPDEAASVLYDAVKNDNKALYSQLFGNGFREFLPLPEIDDEDIQRFLNAWEEHQVLQHQSDNEVLIAIGGQEWTFPIPIVKTTAADWYFDIEKGRDRMRIRAIGRNELAAMKAVLAYYDAQLEYAEVDRNGDGALEYAQKFISSPGSFDGLYWEADADEAQSPLGPLFSESTPEGAYHGYFYRILNAQGPQARGGAYSYMLGDRMRYGFALLAWPAIYGETGVMSFMVNHDSIVYETDLGFDSAELAAEISSFDPGPGWTPTKELQSGND